MNLSKELGITKAVYAEFFFYCKVIRYSIVERTGASSDAAELEPGYWNTPWGHNYVLRQGIVLTTRRSCPLLTCNAPERGV